MTTDRFSQSLPFTLKEEGGFANDPRDPGGATFEGVTLATYRTFVKADATVADLRAAPPAVIAAIYHKHYWDAVSADKLPVGVDLMVFDMAVNAGPGRSIKLLQRVLGVAEDGLLGPKSLAQAVLFSPTVLCQLLHAAHLEFYRSLANFSVFGHGWTRRCDERLQAALGSLLLTEVKLVAAAEAAVQ